MSWQDWAAYFNRMSTILKKGFHVILIAISCLILIACDNPNNGGIIDDPDDPNVTLTLYRSSISTMHTYVNIQMYMPTKAAFDHVVEEVEAIYEVYHRLTDNFQSHTGYFNIYDINAAIEASSDESVNFQIDVKLYDILKLGQQIYEDTDGYFNMTIGKIIDVWKELIAAYQNTDAKVPLSVIESTKQQANQIDIIEDALTLHEEGDKYYINVKKGVKLDLGALAKGYATQRAVDYLEENDYKYYMISGGSSSIVMGERPITTGRDYFQIGLINPTNQTSNYGIFDLKNVGIATSGSYIQFVEDETGNAYHHIISPFTKAPINVYHTVSMVGVDAGLLDGYSTALFSMSPEQIEVFLDTHDYDVITFNRENTETRLTRYNPTYPFRELR